jgi:hypothetical protein
LAGWAAAGRVLRPLLLHVAAAAVRLWCCGGAVLLLRRPVHAGMYTLGALAPLLSWPLLGLTTLAIRASASEQALRKPGWNAPFGKTSSFCTAADNTTNATYEGHSSSSNTRWTHFAIPEGTPPEGGWPIYMKFPPWASTPPAELKNVSCGAPPVVRSCMNYLRQNCRNSWNRTRCDRCVSGLVRTDAGGFKAANCTVQQAYSTWCVHHGRSESHLEDRPPFMPPAAVLMPQCFSGPNGTWSPDGSDAGVECGFVSVNGQLWAQRADQYLLANGIAVVQINPAGGDSWDSPDGGGYSWDSGKDKPFLTKLFAQMRSGEYAGLGQGVLNIDRLSVSGYSVGAQMVSWLIQLHATGELRSMGATLRAGAMFGGGSYSCYRVPPGSYKDSGPAPLAQCSNCNASSACWTVGHSTVSRPFPSWNRSILTEMYLCHACSCQEILRTEMAWQEIFNLTGKQPCCSYCCPQGFTEQHYADHPADYASHPPTFLVQATTVDENADADASINYHNEMIKHNAVSELWRIPVEQERCYCIGQRDDPAAEGSPLLDRCPQFHAGMAPYSPCNISEQGWCRPIICNPATHECGAYEDHSTERCVSHSMGFAGMVEPLTRFLMKHV